MKVVDAPGKRLEATGKVLEGGGEMRRAGSERYDHILLQRFSGNR
jgi:hypothetical protein